MKTIDALNMQLLIACRSGNVRDAIDALERGADPNAVAPGKSHATMRCALSRSIENDSSDILEALIAASADFGESTKSDTSYFERLCYLHNKPRCLEVLLEVDAVSPLRRHMEWALEWGDDRLVESLKLKGLTDNLIEYDINKILESGDPTCVISTLSERLPESWRPLSQGIEHHEETVRDIWELHCTMGNEFSDMIANANFDIIYSGYSAFIKYRTLILVLL